jgi:hypothetical protein
VQHGFVAHASQLPGVGQVLRSLASAATVGAEPRTSVKSALVGLHKRAMAYRQLRDQKTKPKPGPQAPVCRRSAKAA